MQVARWRKDGGGGNNSGWGRTRELPPSPPTATPAAVGSREEEGAGERHGCVGVAPVRGERAMMESFFAPCTEGRAQEAGGRRRGTPCGHGVRSGREGFGAREAYFAKTSL
ncbi:hypothetical protein E2562_032945 [Oryza meyeriana var. granulata]|uniref:Uncharacterized protein n=1 Tax=Oryza meyeriana var. granulata TaxID=110450 RepID=A0A6G1DQ54_9ORYZ|nr:hypothetical protein E2562_032945 [Oryza meyeriana var. granulata]